MGHALRLVVADDGEAFNVAAATERARGGASLGLLGMRERAFRRGRSCRHCIRGRTRHRSTGDLPALTGRRHTAMGGAMKPIRVLLADDHTLLRAGIRSLLAEMKGVEVVAEAADGHEAVSLIKAHRPEILLTDIAMPGVGGLDLTEKVGRDHPHIKVIILSMHKDEEYVRCAVLAGAAGYLLKDSDTEELGLAPCAVARRNILEPGCLHARSRRLSPAGEREVRPGRQPDSAPAGDLAIYRGGNDHQGHRQ